MTRLASSPIRQTISEVFEARVNASPQRCFLLEHRAGSLHSLSYAEAARHVQSVAEALSSQGVQPGDRVALMGRNCLEWAISFFAILQAGAVCVPIHSELGPGEVEVLLRMSDPNLVLTSPGLGEALSDLKTPIRSWTHDPDLSLSLSAMGMAAAEIPALTRDPGDLAVLLFTSGTTGNPKGVMLSHLNLISNVESFTSFSRVSKNDRLLLVLPMHHAFPLTAGLLGAMYLGASLVLESDVRSTAKRMRETRPTVFFGVPALYETMLRAIQRGIDRRLGNRASKELLKRLALMKRITGLNVSPLVLRALHRELGGRIRFVVSGGAAIRPETIHGFLRLGIPLLQGYGLAEASPACTAQPFSRLRFLFTNYYERMAGSVGQALPGLKLSLGAVPELGLDPSRQERGELLVNGPNVMMGYWQDDTGTREAIKGGWLHTGDLARIDGNGNVYIIGRVKDVIVLDSGERFNPEEVEDLLAGSALVSDACLIGGTGHRSLTLFIHPDPDGLSPDDAADPEAIKLAVEREVSQRLNNVAHYKRPARIVIAASPLPRTPLGKVKRFEVGQGVARGLDTPIQGVDGSTRLSEGPDHLI